MKVQVTQEDIDHGERDDCWDCPVALAIRRATNAFSVSVRHDRIEIKWWSGCTVTYPTPSIVCRFIEDFDAGEPVEPIAFDLPDA